jgi:hypothetical protein
LNKWVGLASSKVKRGRYNIAYSKIIGEADKFILFSQLLKSKSGKLHMKILIKSK